MKTFLCELFFSCLVAAPGARSIDELTYGAALYAYYQQDYEQALLEVTVAEHRGRTIGAAVEFELAKGSFAFQQGLYRLAAETFAGVGDDELTELDRMRLAFHLAREHYRLGDWSGMKTELDRIDLGEDWRGRQRRHPEVSFMRAEAALARGDFPAARSALDELPGDSEYLAYGLFNLGVARRQAGDSQGARLALSRLAGLTVTSEESWDLVQRGRLALAMLARQTGDVVDARSLVGSLPGEGRYRDLALASYGKLAMAREDHELAARIWLTLLEQPGWSASHAAARLGLPMSLERLASTAHALDRYREAARVFERRLGSLRQASARVGDAAWVDGLLDAFSNPDDTDRARRLETLNEGLGTAEWLQWLSGEDVHRVLVEWRELTAMAGWLDRLPARIDAYREITRERRRRTAEARALLADEAMLGRRDELARRVAALQADLSALQASPARPDAGWMLRLASDEERELVSDLEAMAALASAPTAAAERSRYQSRIARLRGIVFYRIADDRAARIRALEKRLRENRALLADIDARIERLAGAEVRFAAGVEADFLAVAERADAISRRVAAATDARRRVIAEALERGLERETERTRRYLLAARIAIARATDQLAAAAAEPESGS